MAEFSPLHDYFGLNALVVRFNMTATEIGEDRSSPSSSTAAGSTGQSQVQEFDIKKLSRVFNSRRKRRPLTHCVFCKNNQESEVVYRSHKLKELDTGKITCPILRAYTCPICGASGDQAHTIKYCPVKVHHT